MKVDYGEAPTLFAIMSAFRSLLRRSVLFDINAETNSRYMHSPDDNLTLSDNDMIDQMEMFKKNFDVHPDYRKKHKYLFNGEEKEIQYRFNNVGYRGEDVNGSEKFIAIGCSQTFGSSLEEEFTWPAQLEKIFNSRVVNLGTPGDSARGSIMKAISYINQFGKPEAVFGCFPLYRSEKFAVPGQIINSKNDLAGPFNCMYVKNNFKQISKAPYKYDEIIPMEDHLLETFSFINIFSKYCKEAGIKFIWTGWETMFASNRVENILNENTSGFFFDSSMNDFNFVKDNNECHIDYVGHPLFDYAADVTVESDGVKNGHKGIHWNIHMAEKCYSEYLKTIPIDNILNK
jgi:hypothetical protein